MSVARKVKPSSLVRCAVPCNSITSSPNVGWLAGIQLSWDEHGELQHRSKQRGYPNFLGSLCPQISTFLWGTAAVMTIWVHSSVVRAADCRSAGPWLESGCALHVIKVLETVITIFRNITTSAINGLFSIPSFHRLSLLCIFGFYSPGLDVASSVPLSRHSASVRGAWCSSSAGLLYSGGAVVRAALNSALQC